MVFRLSLLRKEAPAWALESADHRLRSLRAWLHAHGATEQARGEYATIHALPQHADQALKVFSLSKPSGKATWAYLKAVQYYDNPLFPQVFRMAKVQDVALVWMERLEDNAEQDLAVRVSQALTEYFQNETQKERAFGAQDLIMASHGPWHQHRLTLQQLVEACEVLTDVIDAFPECDADAHDGNFMVRKQAGRGAQLVLTDPLA